MEVGWLCDWELAASAGQRVMFCGREGWHALLCECVQADTFHFECPLLQLLLWSLKQVQTSRHTAHS